ncbi:MAG: agarase [Verrucomicrobiaceae bacterium]
MFKALLTLLLVAPSLLWAAPGVHVTIHLDTTHEVGGISQFDRKKFITIHSNHTENDWQGIEDKKKYLIQDLDTYFGRETGAISHQLRLLRQDPDHPGHVEFADMKRRADYERKKYAKRTDLHGYEQYNDLIVAAQVEPFWPGSAKIQPQDGSPPWSLLNPAATAQYMVYWLNMYTGGNGPSRPRFMEIMNEPLYELAVSHPDVTPQQVFDYHKDVATNIRALNKDILIGGYTTAFPDLDKDNFQRWHQRWKSFIDTAGAEMDFYSLHLYDFPGIHHGKKQYRKGCNLEATFDLIDHYSHLKIGTTKPFVISEYGSQLHDWFDEPWSPYRDWLCLKAINSMLMQFAAKPDRILKTIPFITAKAEWGHNYTGHNHPYPWRLLRRADEPAANTGDWVFTDQIKFYELWAGVQGTRRLTHSSDPNLLVHSFLEGNKLSLVLNNLSLEPKTITLKFPDTPIKNNISKHLYLYENKPRLDWLELPGSTKTVTLGAEATRVLHLTLDTPKPATQTAREQTTYANTYLQSIEANKPLTFQIASPEIQKGNATLRLGLGRPHGLSLQPTLLLNGQKINVPPPSITAKGQAQTDRPNFFGVLKIPLPIEHLKPQNEIQITFPDPSGHLSSLTLQTLVIQ